MPDLTNESDIIAAVQKGDIEAFARLVEAHQAHVRLLCLGLLKNADEAQDAAQDVFLKAYQAIGRFKGESSFGTWIYRIATNHCRDLWRKRARHSTDSLDALMEKEGDAFQRLFDRSWTPEGASLLPDELALLGRLLASLSEEDRDILTLSELEELSYEAIAKRLHCTLDAVKGRLKRARQRLIDKCQPFL